MNQDEALAEAFFNHLPNSEELLILFDRGLLLLGQDKGGFRSRQVLSRGQPGSQKLAFFLQRC